MLKEPLYLLVVAASVLRASSELPPGAYDELKRTADEVLLVDLVTVTAIGTSTDGCEEGFLVDASVKEACRSASNYALGDSIQFESYVRYFNTSECQGWVGPSPPPLLEAGSTLLVYLNQPKDDSTILTLAAYGKSFEEDQGCEEALLCKGEANECNSAFGFLPGRSMHKYRNGSCTDVCMLNFLVRIARMLFRWECDPCE